MTPVLRSAGLDAQGFRDMILETARRFEDGRADERRPPARTRRQNL